MIKVNKLDSYYFVTTINEHLQHKNELLRAIDEIPKLSITELEQKIHKTDYYISHEYNRRYLNIFYDMVSPYMQDMCGLLKHQDWEIHNAWFQQYDNNHYHGWHNHPGANWTNVYFLDLPDTGLVTSLFNVINNKLVDTVEIKEGDILTIPAYFLHKSKKNETNERKTIISFNSSFKNNDENEIENLIRNKDND